MCSATSSLAHRTSRPTPATYTDRPTRVAGSAEVHASHSRRGSSSSSTELAPNACRNLPRASPGPDAFTGGSTLCSYSSRSAATTELLPSSTWTTVGGLRAREDSTAHGSVAVAGLSVLVEQL